MGNLNIDNEINFKERVKSFEAMFPENVIVEFYKFVTKVQIPDLEYNSSMIEEIDRYIDNNSPRWIYSHVLSNKPHSRNIIFLIHYYDRNPRLQLSINSKLSDSTLEKVAELKKSFNLGC